MEDTKQSISQDKNYDYRHIHHHFHHHHDSSGELAQQSASATTTTQQVKSTIPENHSTATATPWWGLKRKSANSESSGAENTNTSGLINNVSGVTTGLDVTGNLSGSNFENLNQSGGVLPNLRAKHIQINNLQTTQNIQNNQINQTHQINQNQQNNLNFQQLNNQNRTIDNHQHNLQTTNFNLFRPQQAIFNNDNTQNSTGPSISPIANNVATIPSRQLNQNVRPPPTGAQIDRSQTIPQHSQPGAAMSYLNQMSTNPSGHTQTSQTNMQASTTNTGNFEVESSPATSGFISGGVHHQLLQRPTTQHTITSYHQQKFGTTQMDLHQQHLFQQQSAVSYHNMNLQTAAAQPNLKPSQPEKKSKRSLPVLRKGLRLFNIMKPKERRSSTQNTASPSPTPLISHPTPQQQSLANIQQLNMLYQQDPSLFFRAATAHQASGAAGQGLQNTNNYEFSEFQEKLRQQTKQNLLPQLNSQVVGSNAIANQQAAAAAIFANRDTLNCLGRRESRDFDTFLNKEHSQFVNQEFQKQQDLGNQHFVQNFVQRGGGTDLHAPVFATNPNLASQTLPITADGNKNKPSKVKTSKTASKPKKKHDPNAHIQENGVRPDPVAQFAQQEGFDSVQYKEDKDIYQRSVRKVQRWLMSIPDDPCSYST